MISAEIRVARRLLISYYAKRIYLGCRYRLDGFLNRRLDLNHLFVNSGVQREPLETCFANYLIGRLDLALVDIGCNMGEFSFASAAPHTHTVLIDAQEDLLNFAHRRVSSITRSCVKILGAAGINDDKLIRIAIPNNHSGGAYLYTDELAHVNNADHTIRAIPGINPQTYLNCNNQLVKADIEGSELLLLEQFKTYGLLSKPDVYALEASTLEQALSYANLLSSEYRCFVLDELWATGKNMIKQLGICLKSLLTCRFYLKEVTPGNIAATHFPVTALFFIKKTTCIDLYSSSTISLSLTNKYLFAPASLRPQPISEITYS